MAFLDGRDDNGYLLPDPRVGGAIAVSGHYFLGTAEGVGSQFYKFSAAGTWEHEGADASLSMPVDGTGGHHAKDGPESPPWWTWDGAEGGSTYGGKPVKEENPGACDLLLMAATNRSGAFARVEMIQRAKTTGGVKPVIDPTKLAPTVGDVVPVPYTADYHFYGALAHPVEQGTPVEDVVPIPEDGTGEALV